MNLHEYQAKQLFREAGIPVPAGEVADTPEAADAIAAGLGGSFWMVKAQVHAGGRGKAGGVKAASGPQQLREIVAGMLGRQLVTFQNAPHGQPVHKVLIEAPCEIAAEYYLGALIDRSANRLVFIASRAGGMNIEEIAATQPEKIHRVEVDPVVGLQPYQCRLTGFRLGLALEQIKQLSGIMMSLHRLFVDKDLSLVEINPLVLARDGRMLALDGKINIDDNALVRQPALSALRDHTQEDAREVEAQQHGLNYVSLDGDIGCMVNGAGLAMATMDLIKLHGGLPANFLDVGGGTTAERVAEAFKLILSDPKVKAILVNIFGGIVRCDLIAEGIIKAVQEVGIAIPVVVRLEGTNVEQGRRMLAQSGLSIIAGEGLADAAQKAVAAARGGN